MQTPLQQILQDDIAILRDFVEKFTFSYLHPSVLSGISSRGRVSLRHLVLATDDNSLGRLLARTGSVLAGKGILASARCIRIGAFSPGNDLSGLENLPCADAAEPFDLIQNEPVAVLCCVDCEKTAIGAEWMALLRHIGSVAAANPHSVCVVAALMPSLPPAPDGIEGLSERELSWQLERDTPDKTPGQRFLLNLEKTCREIVAGGFERLDLCRIDGLYGPDGHCLRHFDLHGEIQKSFREGAVEAMTKDFATTVSLTYVTDAAKFMVRVAYGQRHGQIFNFASKAPTVAAVKKALRDLFPDCLAIRAEAAAGAQPAFLTLSTLKTFLVRWRQQEALPLPDALHRTAAALLDLPPVNAKAIAIYGGRLARIKSLELMVLRDIDAFCERHGIKYFLCGGTMLGSIRYGHSIPWDDDLDIGFLRDDFDKFRELFPKEMPPTYSYSSHTNKSGSGYIVDKIRLDPTYFSTRYSSGHAYPDGLFIDCLVYDKTSDWRWLATLHSKFVGLLSLCIQVRWYGRARPGENFRLEFLLCPFLKLFPLRFWTWLFDRSLVLFRRKKEFRHVIDSTGKLQYKGPMPAEGLKGVKRVPFDDGFMAPIPADPSGYLEFDYGPNWLPEPPLSKRVAPHNFARIDLGEFLRETKPTADWRAVDVRGELFEKD